jgi:hypothetical protein
MEIVSDGSSSTVVEEFAITFFRLVVTRRWYEMVKGRRGRANLTRIRETVNGLTIEELANGFTAEYPDLVRLSPYPDEHKDWTALTFCLNPN